MPSTYLILCCPLLLLPSIFPSIRVFPRESALCIRWPKYRSFSFSINPSNENSGLISFRIDWLDLLAVKGNLKSLLQHHNLKASFLQCSAFLMVQLSHPYMSTGKSIALTIGIFVSKVMSLLFNTLSRFVIAFPPQSKCLLTLWLQSPCAVILVPKKIKFATVSTFPVSLYLPWSDGTRCPDLSFWKLNFKPAFFSHLSSSSRSCLVPLHFLPLGYNHLYVWGCWCFSQQSWFQLMSHPAWLSPDILCI